MWGIIKGRGGSWGELLTSPSSLAAASISSIGSQPNAWLGWAAASAAASMSCIGSQPNAWFGSASVPAARLAWLASVQPCGTDK
ncbi:Uncharacterised protein [Mycobacterium tuberculosis]|nr:Uncharacterised protein [Mycobacterium tuberculosis]